MKKILYIIAVLSIIYIAYPKITHKAIPWGDDLIHTPEDYNSVVCKCFGLALPDVNSSDVSFCSIGFNYACKK